MILAIILKQNSKKSRKSLCLTLRLAESPYGLVEFILLVKPTLGLAESVRQRTQKFNFEERIKKQGINTKETKQSSDTTDGFEPKEHPMCTCKP